ncbi:MAG: HPP family protein [Rubrobacter sp.]
MSNWPGRARVSSRPRRRRSSSAEPAHEPPRTFSPPPRRTDGRRGGRVGPSVEPPGAGGPPRPHGRARDLRLRQRPDLDSADGRSGPGYGGTVHLPPSLGPTAFLFFYTPLAASACPRNTICGHLIGVLAGWLSLAVFGLLSAGPALSTGVSDARVGAAALSLGLTAGLMVWLRIPHPPAGATTLIVSLGLLTTPVELGVLMLAVVLLTLQAIAINRLAGLDYPLWGPRPGRAGSGGSGTEADE